MSAQRMSMHPHGEMILAAMPDHEEREVGEIAALLGMRVKQVRGGIDWLYLNGYLNKRKDMTTNLNVYSNRAYKSECQKARHGRWA